MKMLPVLFLGIALLAGCGDDPDDTKTLDKNLGEALTREKVLEEIIENALPDVELQPRFPEGERLCYARNSQTPYTGWVIDRYLSGFVQSLIHYRGGKQDGLDTWWHENGKKETEARYKDGKEDGLQTSWHENGQKQREAHYKDGKKDGLWTSWYENGQKEMEGRYGGRYKDEKADGLWTFWHENGQKDSEGHYWNGKMDGLWTSWHENGQKDSEAHFKYGVMQR